MKKAYGDLEKLIEKLKTGTGGANQDEVNRLNDELARLREEFEQHRDFANENIENLNQEMPHKAEK